MYQEIYKFALAIFVNRPLGPAAVTVLVHNLQSSFSRYAFSARSGRSDRSRSGCPILVIARINYLMKVQCHLP